MPRLIKQKSYINFLKTRAERLREALEHLSEGYNFGEDADASDIINAAKYHLKEDDDFLAQNKNKQ